MTATAETPLSPVPPAALLPPAPLPPSPPRSALARHFGGLPGPFWVVFSGTVINRLGNMVVPFLVFFLGSRGVTAAQTPYVLGALGAGGLVGPVLGGWIADRAGRRPAIVAGMIAAPAAQGLLFVSPDVATLAVSAALVGAASSLHAPAVAAVIADSAAPERRRTAFGLYHWAINIGAAIAGGLGGFLIVHGCWLLFVVDALTCLGFAVVAALRLPAAPAHPSGGTPSGGGYGVVVRDRLLLALITLTGIGECLYAQTEFTLPLAIRDQGLPATTYGVTAVVNALLVVTLQPFATAWLVRFDRLTVWVAASAVTAVGVGLTGLAHTTGQYVLTVVVWTVGELCAGGIITALIADLAPSDARARYQAALTWARGVARFAALAGGSWIYAAFGPATLWWSVGLLGLAGAAAGLAAGPALARRTARA